MGRGKFLIGGFVVLAVAVWLVFSSTLASAQYFYTVDELLALGDEAVGRPSRISGAVLGDPEDMIKYDLETLDMRFFIAHMPADRQELEDLGGLAQALHEAVNDPSRARLEIVFNGEKPDLLKHEAEAIVTGTLGEDGVFYADELLLKCPTRYDEVESDEQTDG